MTIPVSISNISNNYQPVVDLFFGESIFLLLRDKIISDICSLTLDVCGMIDLIKRIELFGKSGYIVRIEFLGKEESFDAAFSYLISCLRLEGYVFY